MHSAAQPTRLVALRDGRYAIAVHVQWRSALDTTTRTASVTVNQSGTCGGDPSQSEIPTQVSALVALDDGDYVEVCVEQFSGDDLFIEGLGSTSASMRLVSAAS